MQKYSRWLLAILCIVGAISSAHANGTNTGTVGAVSVVGSGGGAPQNYDFRVSLTGNPVICNGQTWAYVNIADANYDEIIANILSAKTLAATVTLYWTQVSTGYCQITMISW
jgi:hypothetical protein